MNIAATDLKRGHNSYEFHKDQAKYEGTTVLTSLWSLVAMATKHEIIGLSPIPHLSYALNKFCIDMPPICGNISVKNC